MASFVSDNIRNKGLEYVPANVSRVLLVVGAPTTYANVNTNHGGGSGQLAVEHSVSSADFTISGITGGRRCAVGEKSATPEVNANGVNHWCWVDDTEASIEAYGELESSMDVTTSGEVTTAAHGIRMPAAVKHEA